MDYIEAYKRESFGSKMMGVKILISADRQLGQQDARMLDRLGEEIYNEISAESIKLDPEALERVAQERRDLIGLFDEPIFVEEMPNGYCGAYCCRHRPWFVVTTKVGRIVIGWRKRVIEINWEQSVVKLQAMELFPNEDVTRYLRTVHAWSLTDARRYLMAIMSQRIV